MGTTGSYEAASATDLSTAVAAIAPGEVLEGTYRLRARIGEGGMAEVWEASHERLPGSFAVKVLGRALARNKEALVRFGREATVLASLRHPHVVQVLDFNVARDGTPYLVMELLDGRDLAAVLRDEGSLAPDRVARIVRQIASALASAHERGVVHRDLKPGNIVLLTTPGREDYVKVLDFGISKVIWSAQLTGDTSVMGTPEYMAPEQAQNRIEEIDGATDQFALAALAYTLLVGHEPFRGDSPLATLYRVVHHEPEPLERSFDGHGGEPVRAAVEAVLVRGLAKRPHDRYPDVLAFAEALDAAMVHDATPLPVSHGRWPMIAGASLAAALGFCLGVAPHEIGARSAAVLQGLSIGGPAVAATVPRDVGPDVVAWAPERTCRTEAAMLAVTTRKDDAPMAQADDAATEGYDELLAFWLGPDDASPSDRAARWFGKDPAFDATCAARFGALVERAARGELDEWLRTPRGALALTILLDQIPRNAFRDTPRAFAHDARALAVSLDAQARGLDGALAPMERVLLYLPMMHAEDAAVQARAVETFRRLMDDARDADERAQLQSSFDFAERHRAIVDRFGRFPHRNAILGRDSTGEELAFLATPGAVADPSNPVHETQR